MNDAVAINAIKSRPVYTEVAPNPGAACHVFITDSDGLANIQTQQAQSSAAEIHRFSVGLTATAADFTALDAALWQQQLSDAIAGFGMSSAFYIAGREAFLWQAHKVLSDAGFADSQIHLLPPSVNKRDLFCTHCYHVTHDVTASPAECEGCGRLLLVRDHFSRLMGAYVGVQINAEDPADVPATEELS